MAGLKERNAKDVMAADRSGPRLRSGRQAY